MLPRSYFKKMKKMFKLLLEYSVFAKNENVKIALNLVDRYKRKAKPILKKIEKTFKITGNDNEFEIKKFEIEARHDGKNLMYYLKKKEGVTTQRTPAQVPQEGATQQRRRADQPLRQEQIQQQREVFGLEGRRDERAQPNVYEQIPTPPTQQMEQMNIGGERQQREVEHRQLPQVPRSRTPSPRPRGAEGGTEHVYEELPK
ncbi:hypothetical protein EIN_161700 [Entamoeba invadens IP1]|uniref:Uncharacterized protein n=1 Tax=Entamoeba invadens IP1 TaxID=370355 RepID=A0A0A1TYG2_ENTIV|nr:hypothetical protein EIN_161700 [Entamoeba invadens IP1]ELP86556.1 hypothetical protein EIN_161700 [Entamoeba invadens IP1]|eukprot:XP_004185902.1 hypothetical protein EIN_161700 [Entamoeba invadens IP1]